MTYPSKTAEQQHLETIGEKFIELSAMFLKFIERHGLDEAKVEMAEPRDMRDEETSLCKTPLCHGGWLAVMFEEEGLLQRDGEDSFYLMGAATAARFLGFSYAVELSEWAFIYRAEWGNDHGCFMFGSAEAFGIDPNSDQPFTLTIIAKHYAEVGKRCIAASKNIIGRLHDEIYF